MNIAGRFKILVCETEQEAAVIAKQLAGVWDRLSEKEKKALDELLEKQQVIHMRECREQAFVQDELSWHCKLNDYRHLVIYAEARQQGQIREAKILAQLRKEAEILNKQQKVQTAKNTRKRTTKTDFSGDPDVEEARKGLETGW